jgi:hypothetical protein
MVIFPYQDNVPGGPPSVQDGTEKPDRASGAPHYTLPPAADLRAELHALVADGRRIYAGLTDEERAASPRLPALLDAVEKAAREHRCTFDRLLVCSGCGAVAEELDEPRGDFMTERLARKSPYLSAPYGSSALSNACEQDEGA